MYPFHLHPEEVSDEEVLAAIRSIPVHRADLHLGVPFPAVALSAATARSVVGILAPTDQRVVVHGFYVSFDGVTSTSIPALVEVCHSTMATNPPSTNSTGVTPVATDSGMTETPQTDAAHSWTAGNEPTVLTVYENFNVPTYMGSAMLFYPLRRPMKIAGGQGMVLRVKSPATVNVLGSLAVEE